MVVHLCGSVNTEGLSARGESIKYSRPEGARQKALGPLTLKSEHGPPMTCHGTLHIGQTYLLGELDLDATAQPDAERFHLHPAVLDAATLVAFARTPLLGEPYIPVFLDSFRAYRPLRGRCYVYVPAREAMAASGDVLQNDFLLCDAGGEVLAMPTSGCVRRDRGVSRAACRTRKR